MIDLYSVLVITGWTGHGAQLPEDWDAAVDTGETKTVKQSVYTEYAKFPNPLPKNMIGEPKAVYDDGEPPELLHYVIKTREDAVVPVFAGKVLGVPEFRPENPIDTCLVTVQSSQVNLEVLDAALDALDDAYGVWWDTLTLIDQEGI